MEFDLIIRGGTVVTGAGETRADVGISGEQVVALASELPTCGVGRVLDATGQLILPGAIDVHDHFELPFCGTYSADDFENGTIAGAMGGVTTVIDFAIQGRGTVLEAVEQRRAIADPKVCIDYGLHAGITRWNEEQRREIPKIIAAGLPTFKMFMIYRAQGWQAHDGMLFAALREAAHHGGMVGVHAENNDVIDLLIEEAVARGDLGCTAHAATRPGFTEAEAVARAIRLAEGAGGRLYIFHMAAAGSAEAVARAQQRGIQVEAETCPQYLLLDNQLFARPDGHHFATCPPIREQADREALWAGLADGSIQVVATDTCTFTSEQKAMWKGDFRKIPFGMPGVETLLPLLYSEGVSKQRISLRRMVQILAEHPARLFGLYPEKGTIAVGSDADLVVFDPALEVILDPSALQTNCDYSPYQGYHLTGWPQHTLVRGQFVVEDRRFVGKPGYGKFVARRPGAAWVRPC